MLPRQNRTGRNSTRTRLKCRGPKVMVVLKGKRFLNHPLVCGGFVVETAIFFPRKKKTRPRHGSVEGALLGEN